MRKILCLAPILFTSLLYGQNTSQSDATLRQTISPTVPIPKNAVYAEFLGNGYAYSLNYERSFYSDENLALGARIGIAPGFVPMFTGVGLPLELNVSFLRKNGHAAEVGPGFTWFYGKSRYRNEERKLVTTGFYNVCDVTFRLGYKYTAANGFLFRAAFIPTFAVISPVEVRDNNFFPLGKAFTPWAGISIGYVFNSCKLIMK